jgi:hypothetical protein
VDGGESESEAAKGEARRAASAAEPAVPPTPPPCEPARAAGCARAASMRVGSSGADGLRARVI